MAVAGLGSMCNVAKLCAKTVMRADGLLRCLANVGGWRTSCAEVPGRSSKSDSNNTHEQLNCAVNHESLVSWRGKRFRRGNQNQWQLQQTHRNTFTSKHVQQTSSRTSSMLAHMQRHVLWLLEAFFLRCQARYQNCSSDDRFFARRVNLVACTTGPVAATNGNTASFTYLMLTGVTACK